MTLLQAILYMVVGLSPAIIMSIICAVATMQREEKQ